MSNKPNQPRNDDHIQASAPSPATKSQSQRKPSDESEGRAFSPTGSSERGSSEHGSSERGRSSSSSAGSSIDVQNQSLDASAKNMLRQLDNIDECVRQVRADLKSSCQEGSHGGSEHKRSEGGSSSPTHGKTDGSGQSRQSNSDSSNDARSKSGKPPFGSRA